MARLRALPLVLVAALATSVAVSCGDDGQGDGGEGDGGETAAPSTSEGAPQFNDDGEMNTGGLEVQTPEGWQPITMPQLGFGVAVPSEWEATLLTPEALDSVLRATPRVPDFGIAATRAAQSGAVFYAAGLDPEDDTRVNDLKVQADVDSQVADVEGLEAYAREMVEASDPEELDVTVVDEDAPRPTVEVRYRTTGQVAGHGEDDAEGDGGDGGDGNEEEVTVEGVQRSVLVPAADSTSFVVYSFIVTGESPAAADELAPDIFASLDFSAG